MKKEIETHFIFLDTSVFISENFFEGRKLNAFLKHEKETEIELLTTDITKNECYANLNKCLNKSNSILKTALKELNKKEGMAFKNVESLKDLYDLKTSFNIRKEKDILNKKLSKVFSDHFIEVAIDSELTNKIFDDYFALNPPFKEGNKKHEFPDAYVLNSLEQWCKKRAEKVYVVSEDKDLSSFKSNYLIPVNESEELLDRISYTYSEENISLKVEEIIERNEMMILREIEKKFIEDFPYDGFDTNLGYEYETHDIGSFDGYIESHFIIREYNGIAEVEMSVNVNYTADISFEDISSAVYDKEDRILLGAEIVNTEVYGECTLDVNIEIEYELPGKEIMFEALHHLEITSGIPEDISIGETY